MTVHEIIQEFIKKNKYLQDEHVLGILFYGSYKYGLNNQNSDIDLHIIYDDSNPNHLIRGNAFINGTRIEYFEKTIEDVYLMAENEFANQNNASYSIIGKGEIVYERKGALTNLQKYVINRFKDNLPPLDIDEAREQISIIDNKIQKLENLAKNDSPYFNHLYHIVLEKMRKTHHRIIGISKIPTSKVHKIYTDEAYRKSVYKTNPAPDFVEDYLNLITQGRDKRQMLESLKSFYNKGKQNIELRDDYRIPIKSKAKVNTQKNLDKNEVISSSVIVRLDKKSEITTTDIGNVGRMFDWLKNREAERGKKDDWL